MSLQNYSNLRGQHALLSPSSYHWLNYDIDKLVQFYRAKQAIRRGTELHELAERAIRTNTRLWRSRQTLSMYVNDAIGYKMQPEQVLYYSNYIFGTADACSFRDGFLRIHDLKTGATPASMKQLEIYAALFCLEYDIQPGDISTELRIYQNNDVIVENPEKEDILPIMDKIITFDKILTQMDEEEQGG